jgi:radical SAM superfamily enzyme YgiQ (UPF0313 family)
MTFRITFIHAPDRFYSEVQNNGVIFMPVWAYTLAAHVDDPEQIQLSLLDSRFDRLDLCEHADLFLYSGLNQDYESLLAARATLAARFPKAVHVLGGPVCWSFSTAGEIDKLAAFDHLVVGDGERIIAPLIATLRSGDRPEKIIRNQDRFPMNESRPMYRPLMDTTIGRYYGAVLEVSRGCPFLCEFCDIRILPDNNRPHSKSPDLIIAEIDHLCTLGVRTFLLACDNFIGDLRWAEEVVDALLAWRRRTGHSPVFYTWLTINLGKSPDLMRKMRRAGFDTLFIGVESFDSNSLLETAKVQNNAAGVSEAVREIQSYGFPVMAGLIFGFDSDTTECFDNTLAGLLNAGLLSGDPSLLTALPGTPLYRRMQLAGRLRHGKLGLGGHKYHTNIRYILPRDILIGGFIRFSRKACEGSYQVARLQAFMENLRRGNYIPAPGKGYFDPRLALRVIRNNPQALHLTLSRLWAFARRPINLIHLARGIVLTALRTDLPGRWGYLLIWFAVWSTLVVKYRDITEADFEIESVDEPLTAGHILPPGYTEPANETIPLNKVNAQRRETARSLTALIERLLPTGRR